MKRDARRLKVLRAERELTQSRLAIKAGLSASRYWQIEHGEGSDPSESERQAVAAVLGVKVADIAWPVLERAQAS